MSALAQCGAKQRTVSVPEAEGKGLGARQLGEVMLWPAQLWWRIHELTHADAQTLEERLVRLDRLSEKLLWRAGVGHGAKACQETLLKDGRGHVVVRRFGQLQPDTQLVVQAVLQSKVGRERWGCEWGRGWG